MLQVVLDPTDYARLEFLDEGRDLSAGTGGARCQGARHRGGQVGLRMEGWRGELWVMAVAVSHGTGMHRGTLVDPMN